MEDTPFDRPVTTPEEPFIEATSVRLEIQVPPDASFVRLIVAFTQTGELPTIADIGLTVTVRVTKQPFVVVYVMVTEPAPTPDTPPPVPTLAIVLSELDQVPPGVPLLNVVACPLHILRSG